MMVNQKTIGLAACSAVTGIALLTIGSLILPAFAAEQTPEPIQTESTSFTEVKDLGFPEPTDLEGRTDVYSYWTELLELRETAKGIADTAIAEHSEFLTEEQQSTLHSHENTMLKAESFAQFETNKTAFDSIIAEAQAAAEQKAAEEEAARIAEEARIAAEEAARQEEAAHIATVETAQQQTSSEVSLSEVDWSVGKDAFIAEWGGRIDAYLSGSPLSGYGATFAEAAWNNGIDPRWSPAISNTESSKGAVCFRPHNAWGWGNVSWSNWTEAINAHVSGLASGYGYTISYSAAAKYCPPNAGLWFSNTLAQMQSI